MVMRSDLPSASRPMLMLQRELSRLTSAKDETQNLSWFHGALTSLNELNLKVRKNLNLQTGTLRMWSKFHANGIVDLKKINFLRTSCEIQARTRGNNIKMSLREICVTIKTGLNWPGIGSSDSSIISTLQSHTAFYIAINDGTKVR